MTTMTTCYHMLCLDDKSRASASRLEAFSSCSFRRRRRGTYSRRRMLDETRVWNWEGVIDEDDEEFRRGEGVVDDENRSIVASSPSSFLPRITCLPRSPSCQAGLDLPASPSRHRTLAPLHVERRRVHYFAALSNSSVPSSIKLHACDTRQPPSQTRGQQRKCRQPCLLPVDGFLSKQRSTTTCPSSMLTSSRYLSLVGELIDGEEFDGATAQDRWC
ncbi:hypothetical protein SCHPADRAFT_526660 [Schizopora paradoxa]|uniref:Uncharacterized protein n=1 Tax=Schizopora paradoxa TaxID=27342 RepID=A0A0H2REH3_9AGAM|nr:hypothetical protein SCHPADRAFT_526660 [Schizopora paradoxa]